jgi:DNA-binding LytR/AlgR family response regulator
MYLTIKNGNSFTKIRYSDVVFVEKIAKEIVLHTETNSYTTRKSMSEAEHELRPYGFIRTHVGFLVNLAYVELITPINAILKGGKSVPISRQKLKFVKDMFLERNVMLNE